MKRIKLLLLITLSLSSCATILNSENTIVKISSDKASEIIFNNDTISVNRKQIKIRPKRSKNPLKITVLKDSLKKEFYLNKNLSATYFLNFYNYGAGFFIDLFSHKRFRYNHNLHFITDSVSNKIMLSDKKITTVRKNKIFIYTSPLKTLDFISIPMANLGFEYFIKDNYSISAEYGFFISNKELEKHNITYLEEKANEFRIEAKWYNGINLTKNVHLNEYLGLELREIYSQYNSFIEYSNKNTNQNNFIVDDFATKKNVTVVNLKYGLLLPIGKRFYFDFYTGLGVRIKSFNYLNLEYNENIHQLYDDDFFSFDIRDFEGLDKKTHLNISLGFKFGINL